tara:strand:- start:8212 stop:9258 length:1047 start_codon:yes stop_codon:yes gene_type:complete
MILAVALAATLAEAVVRFVVAAPAKVEVIAETGDRDANLSIHRVEPKTEELGPPIFAEVKSEANRLRLKPRISLSGGAEYRAVLQLSNGKRIEAAYKVPRVEGTVPQVTRIEPGSGVVPANLLKFYVYFDQPMREGRAIFDHFHLVDDAGMEIEAPWRRQEIWDHEVKRLTLLIHPGRIKQGVNLREELGPVLKPGSQYRLVIDPDLRSARGVELGKLVTHEFATGPEIYQILDPATWELVVPGTGTTEPLSVRTDRPVDHAMAQWQLNVLSEDHAPIRTTVVVNPQSGVIELVPADPWREADYFLEIGEWLEDLAGNTRLRVFDTDLSQPEPKPGLSILNFHPETRS